MLPEHLENREFTKVGFNKGYAIAEVDSYIRDLIEAYEQLSAEMSELEGRYEQLDQAHTECKQKVDRAQEILERERSIITEAKAEAEAAIAYAKANARVIENDAREKAAAERANAESIARKLFSEAKARTEAINEENNKRKQASENEAAQLISSAKDQAKKHTEMTCAKCEEMLSQCKADIKRRQDEFDIVAKKAADFRAMLFTAYSEHLLSLENIDIPRATGTTDAPTIEISHDPKADDNDILVEMLCDEDVIEDDGGFLDISRIEMEKAEQTVVSDSDETIDEAVDTSDAEEHTEPDADEHVDVGEQTKETEISADELYVKKANSEPVEEGARDSSAQEPAQKKQSNVYGVFDVETEHSGQVHYDSTNISSVNKKLDDIMKNKNESKTGGVSQKLGFLK